MQKVIAYSELRKIKDSLPDGTIHAIAKELNVEVETIQNYFGGSNYVRGQSCGTHLEAGSDEGFVSLDDDTILNMALKIIETQNLKID